MTEQQPAPSGRRIKFAAFVILVCTALLVGGYITVSEWGITVRGAAAPILEPAR